MRLTKIALLALKGSGSHTKERLAEAAGNVTISTINRWILYNDDNLTKAALLKIITEEIGLNESEILEESTINEGQT